MKKENGMQIAAIENEMEIQKDLSVYKCNLFHQVNMIYIICTTSYRETKNIAI